ncbi:hypothetical protein D3H55_15370 [Bacillus salacetis]|uniref:RCK N-terminal domain-containing protein n=1 Tax=Bacillus salacetis TaxID=2315464 RepID=A0A3A1QZN7_9BACI|nr:hypothetical protein [Bacillus salacetis]RIW31351.1 hypothetical protein D3H55_15370 [Bacillus salacetis]
MLMVTQSNDAVLVCIPNEGIFQLIQNGLKDYRACCFASADSRVIEALQNSGVQRVVAITPGEQYLRLNDQFSKVIVFESHIADTCDLMTIIGNSTCAPVVVVATGYGYPMRLYYSLGAKYAVYSKRSKISCFLS